MNARSILLVSIVVGLVACGSTPTSTETTREPIRESFMKDGPSLALDESARQSDPSTLQLLADRTDEVERLRKRIAETEAETATRADETTKLREELAATRKDKERLESLLGAASEKERAALERSLAAEAARLRMEQELLKAKLGELVKDR